MQFTFDNESGQNVWTGYLNYENTTTTTTAATGDLLRNAPLHLSSTPLKW